VQSILIASALTHQFQQLGDVNTQLSFAVDGDARSWGQMAVARVAAWRGRGIQKKLAGVAVPASSPLRPEGFNVKSTSISHIEAVSIVRLEPRAVNLSSFDFS